ncbi:uncharacterized protein LOC133899329 [Phragmites australis]|uniref:uncharacterized protein LOC133899329 n=1 Tax=Phragmites australis TaxID=29695 RepID=UPI002D790964|nr:uncharacterized protein LOC133899329 [Phragmites australis]
MDGSKYRSKGYAMAHAGRKLHCVLLLLLALAAAALSVVALQKVREQRGFAGLLLERDRQFVSLRISLQKEKAFNREMKRKVEELKVTASSLRTQKADQKTKLKGLEATIANLRATQKGLEAALTDKEGRINQMEEKVTNLKNTKKELEAALTEKENRIKQMEEKATSVKNTQKEPEAVLRERDRRISQMEDKATGSNPDLMAALMEILQRKEAELEEIKTRFQDNKIRDRTGVSSKSTPAQINNASATPAIAVAEKSTNSSTAIPAKSEENRSANTTVVEGKQPRARSLEEKGVNFTTNMEDEGIQGKVNDFDEVIDDVYGESPPKKSGVPRRKKKFLTNNQVNSQEDELDGIRQLWNSLHQDSDRVRYNKLLEKENAKAADEIKKKNNADGNLEKTTKDSLTDADHNRPKQAVEEMTDAADVKHNINISVNSDEAKQQNRKEKKKRFKSKRKKVTDIAATNVYGEVAKQRMPDATSISE